MKSSTLKLFKHGAVLPAVIVAVGGAGVQASATTFTRLSPTSEGNVPASVSEVGGIVTDIVGLNGTRVVSQVSASSLFSGFSGLGNNPLLIGTQTGFDNSVTGALGGGIAEMAVRITLDDGDTAAGNFDYFDNDLLINGVNIGDFSSVATQSTSPDGLTAGSSSTGFRNNTLDTGWFFSNDATTLSSIFAAINSDDEIKFQLDDEDPNDNFYDFTQGVDSSLIDVGSGPQVTPVVPSPSAAIGGLVMLGGMALRRRRRSA